jgi:hypothetical protein
MPNNPMGMRIGIEAPDGTKTIRDDLAAWAFVETASPLAWMLAWRDTAMPRIFRGGSVFAPYLIPPARHLTYMTTREQDATSAPAAVPNADTDDATESGAANS